MRVDCRTGIVAQRKLFAHIHKKLRGHAAAENCVEHEQSGNVRLLHALAEPVAQYELALRNGHFVSERAHRVLHGIHADIRAYVVVYLAPRHAGKRVREDILDLSTVETAAVEDLNGACGDKAVVVFCELLIIYTLGDIFRAEAGHGVVLIAAHLLYEPELCVRAFVVYAALDEVKKLFLLALDVRRQEQSAPRVGR